MISLKSLPALTLGLGVSMLIGYGALFYSFSLLAPAAAAAEGWSQSFIFGALSLGLFLEALAAPVCGRVLDRYGPRVVMATGSLLAALLLALAALTQSALQFGVVTILITTVSIAVQYEAGFAALAVHFGAAARRQITTVTLIAGFASTLFWPVIEWMLGFASWRAVYLVLALVNLLIAFPIHLVLLRGRPAAAEEPSSPLAETAKASTSAMPVPAGRERLLILAIMAVAFAGTGFLFSGISASLVVLLGGIGFSSGTAALAGAVIGPAQVLGRIGELMRHGSVAPVTTALIASVATALGIALLLLAVLSPVVSLALAFGLFYGVGQGLASIIRGTIPLQFFGAAGYGALTGNLSFVRLVVAAAAPFAVILVEGRLGPTAAVALLLVVALITLVAFLWLAAIARR
ncbi:MFS transporter [Martelella endophytica]|uniref:Major facilitator superfamily (MFS) profile domain-containing protein n=1 Tax=Martelella endophytica TaxID=1486262 RepID=A0A0D5LM38_MAREN|nr:MFS transporter [Martelella endophytica]AJY44842.1 hypothetical protein TM49_02690 [Martelella endophytica]